MVVIFFWLYIGLNLMSQFNLENQTHFNTKAEEYDRMRNLVCHEISANTISVAFVKNNIQCGSKF